MSEDQPHESSLLMLSIDKALNRLDWAPRWSTSKTVEETIAWYRAFYAKDDVRALTDDQIDAYSEATQAMNIEGVLVTPF